MVYIVQFIVRILFYHFFDEQVFIKDRRVKKSLSSGNRVVNVCLLRFFVVKEKCESVGEKGNR